MTQEHTVTPEPMVKLGVSIPKSLNQQLNLQAVQREMKKQELVAEILRTHFAQDDV